MWQWLQPIAWLLCVVLAANFLGLVVHHGADVLHRVYWHAPPFPVIDGQVQYPSL